MHYCICIKENYVSDSTMKERHKFVLCYEVLLLYIVTKSADITPWVLLAAFVKELVYRQKSQTRELWQQIVVFTDCMGGKYWNYQKGKKFSFGTYRAVAVIFTSNTHTHTYSHIHHPHKSDWMWMMNFAFSLTFVDGYMCVCVCNHCNVTENGLSLILSNQNCFFPPIL